MKIFKIFLIIFLYSNTYCFESKKYFYTLAHWLISAGPSWIESYKFFLMLNDNKAVEFFGDKDLDQDEQNYIRLTLQKNLCGSWNNIKIKEIKEDIRIYIPHSMICTDTIIFINPDIYDIISKEERIECIIEAGKLIQSKFVLTSTCFLALLPICTNKIINSYTNLLDKLTNHFQIKNEYILKTKKIHHFILKFCLSQFFINKFLTIAYFKNQAIKCRYNGNK